MMVREVRHESIQESVQVIIAKIHAHTALGNTVMIVSDTRNKPDPFEGAIDLVLEKEADHLKREFWITLKVRQARQWMHPLGYRMKRASDS
ncbi:MAG: hypothetical protein EXQ58_00695 [Acidobacteria bacterium]|nr:hypothetical protein [Acidobacteriota bacterium]